VAAAERFFRRVVLNEPPGEDLPVRDVLFGLLAAPPAVAKCVQPLLEQSFRCTSRPVSFWNVMPKD
jgi:hypothetical protein